MLVSFVRCRIFRIKQEGGRSEDGKSKNPSALPSSCESLKSLIDEIEEREQVNPNQIDQVPVKRREVDRSEVVRPELPLQRFRKHPDPHDHAAEHVDAV